ncbi:unnamed protein product, partial [Meganyctiphanes norvegica]
WNSVFDEAYTYIQSLKDAEGQLMYKTRRKTGFIGFLVAIKSFRGIFHDLVESPQAQLKYLLTYKFSQDHLELFFGAVCAAGGANTNPTSVQFTAIYKRLLLKTSIKGGIGNVKTLEEVQILHITG